MSMLSSIAIVCFLLLTWNRMTDGLACYACTNCNDPFNPNNMLVKYYNETFGATYCTKTTIGYSVNRDLVLTTCIPSTTIGNSTWCCQTNLCNGGNKNILTNVFSFGIVILMLIISF